MIQSYSNLFRDCEGVRIKEGRSWPSSKTSQLCRLPPREGSFRPVKSVIIPKQLFVVKPCRREIPVGQVKDLQFEDGHLHSDAAHSPTASRRTWRTRGWTPIGNPQIARRDEHLTVAIGSYRPSQGRADAAPYPALQKRTTGWVDPSAADTVHCTSAFGVSADARVALGSLIGL